MKYNVFGKSIIGNYRDTNQDAIEFINNENYTFAIVCDGMGGHKGGGEASANVVNFFKKEIAASNIYKKNSKKIITWIEKKIYECQRNLEKLAVKNEELNDMGTTIVLSLIVNKKLYLYHAGDSRLYLIEIDNGLIKQITLDHNIQNYNGSNISFNSRALIHALGPKKFSLLTEVADSYQIIDLSYKFVIFLCTDGVYEVLNENEIYDILTLKISLQDRIERLINVCVENDSKDNISCIAIEGNH